MRFTPDVRPGRPSHRAVEDLLGQARAVSLVAADEVLGVDPEGLRHVRAEGPVSSNIAVSKR